MKDRPRLSLAVALSVGAHAAVLAVAVGSSLMGAWPAAPVEIEITGTKAEDVTDLPLGMEPPAAPPPAAPPPVAAGEPEPPPPRRRDPKPRAAADSAPSEDPPPVAPPRPHSVRSYGPAGSRVTALLRLDRLRGTPYASSVDALLMRLPDRRDLLEGTALDLYRDVDALLIATPNPLDPAVTFLAVRHRLTDAALREALERGARATGRTLKWRTERGRPFAERLSAGTAAAPDWRRRDERLILLAAPKLAVVTPPAYRSLILRGGAAVRPARAGKGAGGGGAGAGGVSGGADGAAEASAVAPSPPGAAGPARDEHADWAALVRRIDAEDSIMPPSAVVMFSAEDIFGAARARAGGSTVAGTRGSVDDDGPVAGGERPNRQDRAPTIRGLPAPRLLTATLGITPEPFSNADLTFFAESEAARWEAAWPELRQKLRSNPLVVLTGFSALLGRIAIEREGAVLHVNIQATEMELVRLLQLLATQLFPLGSGG